MAGTEQAAARGFLRSFLGVSAGNYGGIALSFVLNVVLTWRLGAEQYGRLSLLIMAVQVLGCVVFNWTLTGLIKFGAQEFARTGSVGESFWSRLVVVMPWLSAAAVGLAVGQDAASAYFGVPVAGVWLVFGYFVLSGLLLSLGGVFQACQQMPRYAVTLFFDKAAALAGVLILPASYAQDPVAVIGCYAAGSLAVSLWALAKVRPLLAPARAGREAVRAMWSFSLPLILSTWIGLIGTQWINYAIIKHYLTLSDLGLYSLASQVAGVAQQVTIISSSLLLPHFAVLVANRETTEIRRQVERVVPYGLLGFSLLLSAGVLLSGPVIPLLFGPSFAGTVPPLILILVASMGLALFNTFMPLVNAHGCTWTFSGVTLTSAVVNLVAAVPLVPRYGIMGAAWATLLGYWVAAGLMLIMAGRLVGLPLLRYGWLGAPVVAASGCALLLPGATGLALGAVTGIGLAWLLAAHLGLLGPALLSALEGSGLPVPLRSGLVKVFCQKTS